MKIYFGKHKGEEIEHLPRRYLLWLNKQDWLASGTKKAVEIALGGNPDEGNPIMRIVGEETPAYGE